MNEGLVSTKLGLSGNPNIAESIMVFRDLKLAELTGLNSRAACKYCRVCSVH